MTHEINFAYVLQQQANGLWTTVKNGQWIIKGQSFEAAQQEVYRRIGMGR